MPRIDPLQLLKCLSVLLSPEGGILSRDEVPRLVDLMTKFSKKLVSKCIYVLILKNTQTELVDMFMAEGGWQLIQKWLQDAVQTSNWDLVKEILGLLLVTPVDVERLKLNSLPKLIKSLSRREELDGVAQLSLQLVQYWLSIVKGNNAAQAVQAQQQQLGQENQSDQQGQAVIKQEVKQEIKEELVEDITTAIKEESNAAEAPEEKKDVTNTDAINTNSFYSNNKNRKSVDEVDENQEEDAASSVKVKDEKKDDKQKSSSKSKTSSKEKEKDRYKDKDKEKDRDKDKKKSSSSKSSSSGKDKDKSRSSSRSSSKDKDRKDRDKSRDKDKHRHNGEYRSSPNKSSSSKDKKERDSSKSSSKEKDRHVDKDNKEKQAEKDKDTLAKLKPPTIDKLGKIPKKSLVPEEMTTKETQEQKELKEIKKKFSVGVRKDSEERPKTVKIFNSKMRSTGLEEEVKPAPPRPVKKPTPSVQLPTIPTKRPSPPKESHKEPSVPPEKKLKLDKVDLPERPGAIKLIPPKPKPAMLQESDLFNDALTAATSKKEPKKRKRRPSVSKDTPTSPTSSVTSEAPNTPTSPTGTNVSSPLGLKTIAPINFYQDTLSEESSENKDDNKENTAENDDEKNTPTSPGKDTPSSPTNEKSDEDVNVTPKRQRLDGQLRGVLLYSKKKGPKKSISWKADNDLVDIRYFELDETERVNVTKTFGDMSKMELEREREAVQLSRKLGGEDMMEPQIMWRIPYEIDIADPLAVPGSKSLEKDIQFAREKNVLQALYFDKRRIPDSPEEPIPENHQMSDPILIPLEDPESQEYDLRSTPWPEPKGMAPPPEPQMPPQIFPPNIQGPFNPTFTPMHPQGFQGMPGRFPGPGGPPNIPPGNFGPPMMNGGMMVPPNMVPPNEMMNMNPNIFPQGPIQDGYGGGPGPVPGGPDFQMFNPNIPNMPNHNIPNPPNMFPPNNFRPRGGFRRGGNNQGGGSWVRMSGPNNNWKRGGGGGHRGGRLCKNVQNHGFCRNRDNCPFIHPT